MKKPRKNISQKANQFNKKQQEMTEKSQKVQQNQEWSSLMDSKHKKLSQGALNIFLTNRTLRSNRQLKDATSKDHNVEGHPVRKGPKKQK